MKTGRRFPAARLDGLLEQDGASSRTEDKAASSPAPYTHLHLPFQRSQGECSANSFCGSCFLVCFVNRFVNHAGSNYSVNFAVNFFGIVRGKADNEATRAS